MASIQFTTLEGALDYINRCVEKAKPKRLRNESRQMAINGGDVVIGNCPECGAYVIYTSSWGQRYCSECGQAISHEPLWLDDTEKGEEVAKQ